MLLYIFIIFLLINLLGIKFIFIIFSLLCLFLCPKKEKIIFICAFLLSLFVLFVIQNKSEYMMNYNKSYLSEGFVYRQIDNHFDFYESKYSTKPILVYSYKPLPKLEGKKVKLLGVKKIVQKTNNKHGFNFEKHILAKNYKYGIYIKDVIIIDNNFNDNFYRKFINKIYNYFDKVSNKLDKNAKEIYKSLFLGRLSKEYTTLGIATKLGLIHLFVISGFHFNILILVLFFIFNKIKFIDYRLSRVLVLIIACLYYSVIGGGFGAKRVLVLMIISLVAFLINRKINKKYILILIAFMFILENPFIINEIGFLLTFSISLFLIHISEFDFIKKIESKILQNLCISIVLSFVTSIFLSVFSKEIVWISFLIIPIASILLEFITIAFILFTLLPFLDFIFVPVLNYIADVFNEFLISLYSFRKLTYLIPKIIAVLLLIVVIYFFVRKKLISYSFKKSNLFLLLLILLVIVFSKNTNSDFTINVYDLKDGESYLIKNKNVTILYDVGNDKEIISLLRSDGVKKIDLIMISHADIDHYGMLDEIYKNFDVKKVIINPKDQTLKMDDLKFDFIKIKSGVSKRNDLSLVCLLTHKDSKILFTGDIEEDGIDYICNNFKNDIDILKIPHHGSYPENFENLLNAFNPEYAIISGGRMKKIKKEKTYAHLLKKGIKFYDTVENGQLILKIKKNKFQFNMMKE